MKFNEYQEVYNSSRKQIESVRLGDVSYIITCRVMQSTRDIEEWEDKLVKFKLEYTGAYRGCVDSLHTLLASLY